jgi:hypothetical protein
MFSTPVLFLVFNRPDVTAQTFARIRQLRPKQLFLVADGARASQPADIAKVAAVRDIVGRVDWPCEVLKNFASENMGCRGRVSTGISWFFEQVAEGIIVEDDCLPEPSFFPYCAELLDHFRSDSQVMHIGGTNLQPQEWTSPYSYRFSLWNHVWGWATWRRAWRHYDVAMKLWPAARAEHWLWNVWQDSQAERVWTDWLQEVYDRRLDTWDWQWAFACWMQGGLHVIPRENLVRNIGFGADATHTGSGDRFASAAVGPISFPLKHPPFRLADACADRLLADKILPSSAMGRLRRKCLQLLARPSCKTLTGES